MMAGIICKPHGTRKAAGPLMNEHPYEMLRRVSGGGDFREK